MAESTRAPWWERHQISLYLMAILIGAAVGALVTGSALLEVAIEPALGLLLFATFLGVPFGRVGEALRDTRFLIALGVLNFILVPIIVYAVSRFVADDAALLFGVLLVLLTPCVDYVIVFAGLAGGSAVKLLTAAPLLMLAQMVLLPLYLLMFIGPSAVALIEPAPFVRAFLLLIMLPLAAALAVQWGGRKRGGRGALALAGAVERLGLASMVPLMMLTLFVVVTSQVRAVGAELGALVRVVPLFLGFAIILVVIGILTARVARLDVPASRSLTFSGVTRNSLVVLPLALALPAALSLAPLVVVTQTLVELVMMVVLVRLSPRLLPAR